MKSIKKIDYTRNHKGKFKIFKIIIKNNFQLYHKQYYYFSKKHLKN